MNVASLDLCRQLYELSGWKDCYWWHVVDQDTQGDADHQIFDLEDADKLLNIMSDGVKYPAYDLGFILRKLPASTEGVDANAFLVMERGRSYYKFYYSDGSGMTFKDRAIGEADTPENAACKLAIELFKQGALDP